MDTIQHTYKETGVREGVMAALTKAGANGLTSAEMRTHLGTHHGATSGAMSDLHAMGHIARTSERRGNYRVYVLPQHLGSRVNQPQGRTRF